MRDWDDDDAPVDHDFYSLPGTDKTAKIQVQIHQADKSTGAKTRHVASHMQDLVREADELQSVQVKDP